MSWLADLRNLIRHCEYGDREEPMLLDRPIDGTADPRLKDTLQAKHELPLSNDTARSQSPRQNNPQRISLRSVK